MAHFLGLHRLQSPSDRQRPFLVTRAPNYPPRSSELVVRIQGKVVAVELGPLGNWSRRTNTAACARAVKSVTLGCQDPNIQAWLDTLTASMTYVKAFGILHLPVAEDTVMKFEHRVFQRRGTFRSVPDIFDANHLLQEVAPQWTITDPLPVFQITPDPPGLVALDPTLIQVGDFVDVSATISITLNQHRQFYVSNSLLRVIQLMQAPTFAEAEEAEVPANQEDEGGGPVLDFVPPAAVPGDTLSRCRGCTHVEAASPGFRVKGSRGWWRQKFSQKTLVTVFKDATT
ncbi:hypothetical protein M407DRAFT_12079 [Tulasnella calospora MUT 4182]|uniref:Uncharacterized protein n=1 Tax=Tulasnella calospora MUT 4182 TaxID=1051891 RepID=A0A0C3L955_9AGAM|nr:hypothetical protein M407DRAFT_12079 [Tulasnella calospora MUT 4182]